MNVALLGAVSLVIIIIIVVTCYRGRYAQRTPQSGIFMAVMSMYGQDGCRLLAAGSNSKY